MTFRRTRLTSLPIAHLFDCISGARSEASAPTLPNGGHHRSQRLTQFDFWLINNVVLSLAFNSSQLRPHLISGLTNSPNEWQTTINVSLLSAAAVRRVPRQQRRTSASITNWPPLACAHQCWPMTSSFAAQLYWAVIPARYRSVNESVSLDSTRDWLLQFVLINSRTNGTHIQTQITIILIEIGFKLNWSVLWLNLNN